MAGQTVALDMQGCDADGATFAVSHVRLADTGQAAAALAGWQTATLRTLHATSPQVQPFQIAGGQFGLRWAVQGQRAHGRPLAAQAVWFAQPGPAGVDLYHALVLADTLDPAVADTFFAGLKLP
jgi:hypothetical protein